MPIELIGYAAAILTTISFLPQVIKVWQTRSARDISLPMYGLFIVGTAMWLSYGVAIHSVPVALANAATLVLAGAVLVAKLRFGQGQDSE
jgi:MtN3 and saliva related transmembrane protein